MASCMLLLSSYDSFRSDTPREGMTELPPSLTAVKKLMQNGIGLGFVFKQIHIYSILVLRMERKPETLKQRHGTNCWTHATDSQCFCFQNQITYILDTLIQKIFI